MPSFVLLDRTWIKGRSRALQVDLLSQTAKQLHFVDAHGRKLSPE
jgi:hypothetical protein